MSHDRNLQKAAVYQLLAFIYTHSAGLDRSYHVDETNYHIERALSIMQNSVFSHLTLDMLSSRLNLDKSYFIRLFRKKMKITPMKYFMKLKIEAASSMLINTDVQLKEIAARLAFSSEFHLSRVFKESTGLSPLHYRKLYMQTLGPGGEPGQGSELRPGFNPGSGRMRSSGSGVRPESWIRSEHQVSGETSESR